MDKGLGWVKDTTAYVLFKCPKCKQYLYAKTEQKTKKCLRCGVIHEAIKIIKTGEIVYGLSNAIEMVKKRQHELALKELGNNPEFNSFHEFKITNPRGKSKESSSYKEDIDDFNSTFITILEEIRRQYSTFPMYLIELKAEEYGIQKKELQILINSFTQKGILKKTKQGFFIFKK